MARLTVEVSASDLTKWKMFLRTRPYWCKKPSGAEILGGFISDLVDGDASGGSDERCMAESYFNRRWTTDY